MMVAGGGSGLNFPGILTSPGKFVVYRGKFVIVEGKFVTPCGQNFPNRGSLLLHVVKTSPTEQNGNSLAL